MKTIGVFTKDFSLYYDLLRVLKKRNIAYVSLDSPDNIPSKVGVILTSHRELHDMKSPNVIAVDVYDTIDHAIDLALHMLIGKDAYSKVFIGIDPGDKPGVAVVGDDILLNKINVETPEEVVSIVKRFYREYPSIETIIRIGHGSITNRNRIINSLISLGIPIEIVNETKTTSSQQTKRLEKDGEAAAAIALLRGGKVNKKLPLEPTKGEIKNIQERSRKLAEGEFSISEKTALRVLKGELSLKEAVELEKNQKKPKCL
ncbi:MAG: hypothetical protein ACQXXF_06455 [Thermoplasmatota archaeon]|jgi:hypothetical protein